jgi:CrcB protein
MATLLYGEGVALLWVCAGGALGAGGRYLVGLLLARSVGVGFPWGTLTVNVVGSFLLGFLMQATEGGSWRPEMRLALGTGALGGFTTYSTFNLEALRMVERGAAVEAVAYGVATVVGALVAGALGLGAARMWAR